MKVAIILGTVLTVPTQLLAGPFRNRAAIGDMWMSASIFYAYGMSAMEKDWAGTLQFTGSLVSAQLATQGLKETVQARRPDYGDNMSFPSGHAAAAWSSAMFVHKRYGWKQALFPYAMAGAVAWSRVDQRAHYWHDVIAAAGVSALFTWILVDRYENIRIEAAPGHAKLNYNIAF